MSDLAVSSVDDLAQAIRTVDGAHSLGAGALAEALIASGVVRVVPDEETLAGLVANERKLFEDAPRRASVFCDAHLYGFENGIRAALALFKGGEK